MILIIIAFALSIMFMFGGWLMLGSSHGMGGIAGLIAGVYPGVLGLILACVALVARWIPFIKGASVYLAWGSCIATVSIIGYTLIAALIGWISTKVI